MAEVVGDLSGLHLQVIPFNAVFPLKGADGAGHFSLVNADGLKQLIAGRAMVRVVSESLSCQIISPPQADRAATVSVAIVPADLGSWPTTTHHILTIGGSAVAQHSLFVPAARSPVSFAADVAHQIKPRPLVGSQPEVVYCYTIVGGDATSTATLRVSGTVEVSGVGFMRTW